MIYMRNKEKGKNLTWSDVITKRCPLYFLFGKIFIYIMQNITFIL